jgi:hypothetical protein
MVQRGKSMKYRLTDETKEWNGHTLHKIEYTEEWLKEQDLDELEGGWIESEKNLSQDGNARVYGDAWVYGEARVYGDALVYGEARVSQGRTTSMRISTTEQWYEYQYRKAELQKKWDKESKDED